MKEEEDDKDKVSKDRVTIVNGTFYIKLLILRAFTQTTCKADSQNGKDEDLRLLRRSRRNSCEADLNSRVDKPSDKETVSVSALKALKSKAQSAQNLLGSVSSDAIGGSGAVHYRGPVAGISKAAPQLNYAVEVDLDDDADSFSLVQQRTNTPSARNSNYSVEEKSSRQSSKGISAGSGNIKSYSSDAVNRNGGNISIRSPKRQQQDQSIFDKYIDDAAPNDPLDDDYSESQLRSRHKQHNLTPPDGPMKNLRIAPPPPPQQQQQPHSHATKSLRRTPEGVSPSNIPQHSPFKVDHSTSNYGLDTAAAPAPPEYVIEDMAIRVVVRKRPLSKGELSRGEKDVMEVANYLLVAAYRFNFIA